MKFRIFLTIAAFFTSAPVLAQSVGGGLGGDRPSIVVPVSAHPKNVPPLPRLAPSRMTCSDFAEASARLKRYRVDLQGYSVRYFIVLMDKTAVHCVTASARKAYPVRTLDRESCVVGYSCAESIR
ncbi:MAG TPA: hypothetical protein PL182_03060 [Pseudobdellovibrionaceae bacterium]|nr:hypothetical protein [Pseudobdellovibrionaceae bacterium]